MNGMTKKDRAAEAMSAAREWLTSRNVCFRDIPPHHIKIGLINFWPGRGTITIDGADGRCTESGLDGLEVILKRHRHLPA